MLGQMAALVYVGAILGVCLADPYLVTLTPRPPPQSAIPNPSSTPAS